MSLKIIFLPFFYLTYVSLFTQNVGIDVEGTAGITTGIRAIVTGVTGTKTGVIGNATGSGINRGIFGSASGGSSNFAGYFQGQVSLELVRSNFSTFNQGLDLAVSGTSGSFIGITGRYTGLSNQGVGLFFSPSGSGLNVGSPNGVSFMAVNASAFNLSSDKNLKRNISTIQAGQAGRWMEQIRNIESATFWYNYEDNQKRNMPHIGVIAQSVPKELQTEVTGNADGKSGEYFLGVSLSDWLGLVTIGVKENDHRITGLEKDYASLSAENIELKSKLEAMEEKFALVEKLVERLVASEAALGYSIGQVNTNTESNDSLQVETRLEKAQGINLKVSAYPNPTIDYLTLEVKDFDLSGLYYQLFDMNGKLLQSRKITDNHTRIIMSNLVPTTYFIKVFHSNELVNTLKIIKN